MAELSPMMKQYFQIKEQNKDCILFYRLGDFYEMFYEDAKIASRELELTLTGRDCGQEERAPMCGVPFHSCEGYIARLVAKGYKVAICEQTEDPKTAKGLVKRDIIRVITPGTVTDASMLEEGKPNYLAAVLLTPPTGAVAFCDISTGEFFAADY
ncbi:MAG: DNA mismatch repair protein MutS, partial [Ruminococcus sp.]|nr:DNA mismatch repair protein MutS [Ruminococcus sp.]